jgi:hypothetical protein
MDPGTCDKCGCRVPKPTPEHAAWIAKEHRQYCPGCLQDRKAAFEVVKRLKAGMRRAAHAAASANAQLTPPPGHLLVEKLCEALFGGKIEEHGEGRRARGRSPEPATPPLSNNEFDSRRRTPLPAVVPAIPPVVMAIIIVMSGIPMFQPVITAIPVASLPVRAIVPKAITRPKAIRIIICRIRIVERDAIAETDTEAAPGVCGFRRGKDKQYGSKSRNYDQILDFIHFRLLLLPLVMSFFLHLRPYY